MRLVILAVLPGLVFLAVLSEAADQDVNTIFEKGCDFYEDGDFEAAVEHFAELAESGVRDATVYYNLANCYFRQDRMGKAVANYRRALMLAPRDRDATANLELLRRTVGAGDTTATYHLGNLALIPLRLLSPRELQAAFYVGYYVTVLCFLGILFFKGGLRRVSLRAFILSGIVTIAFLVFSSYGVSRFNDSSDGVVISDAAGLKSGPGDAFSELTRLPDGAEVRLRAQSGLWIEVELPGGEVGWLRQSDLEHI